MTTKYQSGTQYNRYVQIKNRFHECVWNKQISDWDNCENILLSNLLTKVSKSERHQRTKVLFWKLFWSELYYVVKNHLLSKGQPCEVLLRQDSDVLTILLTGHGLVSQLLSAPVPVHPVHQVLLLQTFSDTAQQHLLADLIHIHRQLWCILKCGQLWKANNTLTHAMCSSGASSKLGSSEK